MNTGTSPVGWAVSTVGEVTESFDHLRVPINSTERAQRQGPYPYYGANGQVGTIDGYRYDGDFALIAEDGGYFDQPERGVAYRATGKFWVNNHAHVLGSLGGMDVGFLVHWLNASDWMPHVGGSTRLKLTAASLKAAPFPLPPLNEQRRIVAKLDALFERSRNIRDKLDRIPTLLDKLRKSILAAGTSGQLTKEWREAAGRNSWGTVKLGDVCQESFYGPRFGKNEYSPSGIPTIRTTDMTSKGGIEITADTPRIEVPPNKLEQFRVKKGDLLVTRTGSIGVMAVFEDDYDAIPSAYLIRFRFDERVLPRFIFYCLMAPAGQDAMGLSSTAITQPNINAEAIKRIKVALPELDEQREVVRRLDALLAFTDRLEARVETARSRVDLLSRAILAKAFCGELVPQDPNDEPASALLERIRAERSMQPTAKRIRKATTARTA